MKQRNIELIDESNEERVNLAKSLWGILKHVNSSEDLTNYIATLNFYGFDLCNRNNRYNSRNYDFDDIGNGKIYFSYYMSTRGKMVYKNIGKSFYICEVRNDGKIAEGKFHKWTNVFGDRENQESEIKSWIETIKTKYVCEDNSKNSY